MQVEYRVARTPAIDQSWLNTLGLEGWSITAVIPVDGAYDCIFQREANVFLKTVFGDAATTTDGAYSRPLESGYAVEQPFSVMSLTDACLKVLRDHADKDLHEQWLDKNQVEYLITRGGYEFKTGDPTNSVGITLRRLAVEGLLTAHVGSGTRPTKYHFSKERLPAARVGYLIEICREMPHSRRDGVAHTVDASGTLSFDIECPRCRMDQIIGTRPH